MSDFESLLRAATQDRHRRARLAELLAPIIREVVEDQACDPLETMLVFGDRDRLDVHPTAKVNNALFNLSSGRVTVGEFSFFGHGVSVLTGSHNVEKFGKERQEAIPREGHDVHIGDGVWVASNATIVGPCRIGDHAVVGVGSIVLDDVDAYTIVAGNPAKVIRTIDHPPDA